MLLSLKALSICLGPYSIPFLLYFLIDINSGKENPFNHINNTNILCAYEGISKKTYNLSRRVKICLKTR